MSFVEVCLQKMFNMIEHTNNPKNSSVIYTDKKLKKEANTQYLGPILFF